MRLGGDCSGFEDSTIAFQLAGANLESLKIELPLSAFLVSSIDLKGMNSQTYCLLGIQGTVPQKVGFPGKYVMGSLFLNNFYSVFDADNQKIGFAFKSVADSNTIKSLTFWIIGGAIALGLLIATVMVSLCVRKRRRELQKKLLELEETAL